MMDNFIKYKKYCLQSFATRNIFLTYGDDEPGEGGGVLSYIDYTGMIHWTGYGFSSCLS